MAHRQAPLSDADVAARLRGIALICAAVLAFTFIDVPAKYASRYVPTLEVVWARYALSLVFAVVVLRPWRSLHDYFTDRPLLQITRALFLLLSTVFNFLAIRHLPLAQTVSITFASPLLVTAFAGPLLGEWAGPRRWAAVIVGFAGVLIVMEPQPSAFHPAALLSLAAAFCYAGYYLTTRMLSATDSPAGMLIYGSLLATVLLAPALPVVGELPPTVTVTVALAVAGLAGGLGHWFLILASRHAPAPVLAPFTYTQVVWMAAAGYLFFGDAPSANTLLGVTIVIASGLYILYRERVHRDR
jgi:drug/metabolite transporter (DMT)-like permease